MEELSLALDKLFETKIESYQYDMMNRRVNLHCLNGSTNARYSVVIFGIIMFAGVDERGDRFDAYEDLQNGYLECSSIFVAKEEEAFVAHISHGINMPKVSISANLIIDIWGCTFLYIRAKGISINGREFLLI